MIMNLVITGVGGQGNVLASQILGLAAVRKGMKVTIGETFGLSQRGGPVMSHVRFHQQEYVGPVIPPNSAHIIMGLEPLETIRVLPELANEDTIVLVNERPIYPLNVIAGEVEYPDPMWIKEVIQENTRKCYWVNATKEAMALGAAIFLNSIMLGALTSIEKFPLKSSDILQIFEEKFKGRQLDLNKKAFEVGIELIKRFKN